MKFYRFSFHWIKLFFLLGSSLSSLEPLIPKSYQPLKISIIIPCHHRHFEFLEPLLMAYANQLEPTDEIVISLSGVEQISPALIARLERRRFSFPVHLIKTFGSKDASENRNIACSQSHGDLLICQDADDLPHRQRVKILRYLFEHYQIDLLIHQFDFQMIADPKPLSLNQCPNRCHLFQRWTDHEVIPYIQHGSPALLRHVFETLHWKAEPDRQEDTWFNYRASLTFPHLAILAIPLIAYRPQHSAWSQSPPSPLPNLLPNLLKGP